MSKLYSVTDDDRRQTTYDDDRRQRAKQYWPIRRVSNNRPVFVPRPVDSVAVMHAAKICHWRGWSSNVMADSAGRTLESLSLWGHWGYWFETGNIFLNFFSRNYMFWRNLTHSKTNLPESAKWVSKAWHSCRGAKSRKHGCFNSSMSEEMRFHFLFHRNL